MTFSPPTLTALAAYWVANGGVNLGVVGDASHMLGGTSYHLGKSDLVADAYSTRTARDRAGLSEAASAIDLGRLGGSLIRLQDFSKWLVAEARKNAPGTSDMREIIFSPDGTAVLRWDRERGYNSLPKPGEADTSHRTHTHVSWYRDAENRDHRTAFRPYFEGAPDMAWFPITVPGGARAGHVTFPSGVDMFKLEDGTIVKSTGLASYSATSAIHDVAAGSPGFIFSRDGTTYWVRSGDVSFTPSAGGDTAAAVKARDTEWIDALSADWPAQP